MKKTIIHVIDSLGVGGAETLLCTTIAELPEFRHVVCYLTPPHTMVKQIKADRICFLDFRSNIALLGAAIKLRKIIKKENPLLLHSHLLRSTWISRFATINKVPLVFTIHNSLSEDAFKVNRLSLLMEKLTYTKSQTLISVSQSALKDYNEWVGIKGSSYVLHNIISNDFFTVQHPLRTKTVSTRLVAVGSLRRQKNYLNLVKSFTYLKDKNITLDIYGKGDDFDILDAFIKQHHLPIQLKGLSAGIAGILAEYDAFIMPSLFEGYGIAPVEAMAAGLPLILSNLEVFHEITGSEAIFFDPLEPASIAASINSFIELSQEERQQKSIFGRQKAKDIASREGFVANITKIYQSVY